MLVASFIYIKITRDAPENIGRTERISGEEAKIVSVTLLCGIRSRDGGIS